MIDGNKVNMAKQDRSVTNTGTERCLGCVTLSYAAAAAHCHGRTVL